MSFWASTCLKNQCHSFHYKQVYYILLYYIIIEYRVSQTRDRKGIAESLWKTNKQIINKKNGNKLDNEKYTNIKLLK